MNIPLEIRETIDLMFNMTWIPVHDSFEQYYQTQTGKPFKRDTLPEDIPADLRNHPFYGYLVLNKWLIDTASEEGPTQ